MEDVKYNREIEKAMNEIKKGSFIELPECRFFGGTFLVVVWHPEDDAPLVGVVERGSRFRYRNCTECGTLYFGGEVLCHNCKNKEDK